jgi:hypothetical protein
MAPDHYLNGFRTQIDRTHRVINSSVPHFHFAGDRRNHHTAAARVTTCRPGKSPDIPAYPG